MEAIVYNNMPAVTAGVVLGMTYKGVDRYLSSLAYNTLEGGEAKVSPTKTFIVNALRLATVGAAPLAYYLMLGQPQQVTSTAALAAFGLLHGGYVLSSIYKDAQSMAIAEAPKVAVTKDAALASKELENEDPIEIAKAGTVPVLAGAVAAVASVVLFHAGLISSLVIGAVTTIAWSVMVLRSLVDHSGEPKIPAHQLPVAMGLAVLYGVAVPLLAASEFIRSMKCNVSSQFKAVTNTGLAPIIPTVPPERVVA